jgi:hypothetical protein
MSAEPTDFDAVREDLQTLAGTFSTLLIATVSESGEPNASYAAYVTLDGGFYVFVSELSLHTQNLLANGRASVLFIEDETNAGHLFARKRVTYRCQAVEVERSADEFDRVLDQFAERFGNLIDMLRSLQDFHLFRLSPSNGLFVAGFAQAYEVADPPHGEIRHIRDKGHTKSGGGTVTKDDVPDD